MASAPGADRQELVLGVVTGAHGIRGAVKVHAHGAGELELPIGAEVALVDPTSGTRTSVTITRLSQVPGKSLVRLFTDEITTREAAEQLRGRELRVPRDLFPELEDEEFYLADVMDRTVRGTVGGGPMRDLGVVVGLTSNGEQDLLEVAMGTRHWLLPVLPGFIVELTDGELIVDLPAGMGPEDAR